MAESAVKITEMSLLNTLQRYAYLRSQRGRTLASTLRKVMREWVHQAYDFTMSAAKPNKAKIHGDMMRIITTYKKAGTRKSKAADEMRGTLAARLIWLLDWRGARGLKGTAYYRHARKFREARKFSSGIHIAGFFPSFDLVHGRPAGQSGPRYRKAPLGKIEEKMLNQAAEIISENWASAKDGIGMQGLAGGAFASTAAAVEAKFKAFVIQDEKELAQKTGVPIYFF